ncbi:hypothetical protein GCM10009642_03800 [Nocardiopsis metallicus]|uniref:Uncharacterized protein n=1 Tax=Nocardiopsis metallicus TaxID=179819 RepID=A0A840WNT5_9ACTN|nr:hypothetical protein [Nocardiopsis metallicus]MBB5493267.1 hypothetical protein [Nocardiopsis metallicus]
MTAPAKLVAVGEFFNQPARSRAVLSPDRTKVAYPVLPGGSGSTCSSATWTRTELPRRRRGLGARHLIAEDDTDPHAQIDSTVVRAHQHAAGARRRGALLRTPDAPRASDAPEEA